MRFIKLSYLTLFFLVSCAQVGTITGGDKDVLPPEIKKKSIKDNAVNFTGKEIVLEFNEFVRLAQQQDNIAIIPPDAIILSQLNKKSLTLSWTEALKANTTYRIYLNNAVKDISEGNSEVINILFSTGPKIDSLQLNAVVYDAFFNKPLPNALVGLYDSLNQLVPRYFSQSDANGLVSVKNIAEGSYYCKAILDLNKDLRMQANEIQGGLFNEINIGNTPNDTLRISLSQPRTKDKIKNVKYIPPGLIGLHFPKEANKDSLFINDKAVKEFIIAGIDSVLIPTGPITSDDTWFINCSDSIRVRTVLKDRSSKLSPQFVKAKRSESYPFHAIFELRDKISRIDPTKFVLLNDADSVKIKPDSISFSGNKLEFFANWSNYTAFLIHGDEGAVVGESAAISATFNAKITVPQKRDFGSIVLNVNALKKKGILQLMTGENLVRELPMGTSNKYVFSNLTPGEYYVRIIEDENENGQWDPINWETKRQAEKILWYRSIIKVRANWEVESTLLD